MFWDMRLNRLVDKREDLAIWGFIGTMVFRVSHIVELGNTTWLSF